MQTKLSNGFKKVSRLCCQKEHLCCSLEKPFNLFYIFYSVKFHKAVSKIKKGISHIAFREFITIQHNFELLAITITTMQELFYALMTKWSRSIRPGVTIRVIWKDSGQSSSRSPLFWANGQRKTTANFFIFLNTHFPFI